MSSREPRASAPREGRPALHHAASRLYGALFLLLACLTPLAVSAKTFLSVDESLRSAFPGCAFERRTAFLTAAQMTQVRVTAGTEVTSALVTYYVASTEGKTQGVAYLDTHKVRTQAETLLIVVDPRGQVARIETLAFREPEDYLPRGNWYGQFVGRSLTPGLQLKGEIHPVTGATLTARAVTNATRRVLAIHALLFPRVGP